MGTGQTNGCDIASVLSLTENRSKILAAIIAMVCDFTVAEDLFQETVLEVLKSQSQYQKDRPFLPWACGIARHVVFRYWEREARKPQPISQEILERLSQVAIETDPVLWHDESTALQVCLDKLPARMRTLVMLRYGHSIKGQDLADQAGIRNGSIRTTLSRLRSRLRECIHQQLQNSYPAGIGL